MTTTRIKLVYDARETPVLAAHRTLLRSRMSEWFDFEIHDPDAAYDPCNTVLMVMANSVNVWWQSRLDQGLGLIIENVTEVPEFINLRWIPVTDPRKLAHRPVPESAMVLNAPNFFWYKESWELKQRGHDLYQPQRRYRHRALIPVARTKPHRSALLSSLGPVLDQCVWSHVEAGRCLPGDVRPGPGVYWTRHFDPDWYDSTCISVVAESTVDSSRPFITEKTYKAMAFQHPFAVLAEPGLVTRLHDLGFETWNNLWDESYDQDVDLETRIAKITNIVADLDYRPWDTYTLQKLAHNHARFFDTEVTQQFFLDEIVHPILEYANTAR